MGAPLPRPPVPSPATPGRIRAFGSVPVRCDGREDDLVLGGKGIVCPVIGNLRRSHSPSLSSPPRFRPVCLPGKRANPPTLTGPSIPSEYLPGIPCRVSGQNLSSPVSRIVPKVANIPGKNLPLPIDTFRDCLLCSLTRSRYRGESIETSEGKLCGA